ncbi:pentatricopeptide repeat-containing protein At5g50390, chloroplastic-like [Musa acuminata AAA Group]|uniref:pentatricopeptide repeat-containing protein At5g50390, chloroplastic-like n=1 Tax=Musa acuminata AAA Group TaxID=214697 RepID=UPI0031DEC28A
MEINVALFCNLTSDHRIRKSNWPGFSCFSIGAKTGKRIKIKSFCCLDLFATRNVRSCVVVRCSSSQENCLRPKPRPKPKPIVEHVDRGSNLDDTYSASPDSSAFFDHIEKLVFFKRYEEALELFEILRSGGNLVAVRASTYDSLVSACIGVGSVREVKTVFQHMIETGFKFDQYMRNRVLGMHLKCGMMVDARHLFDDMPDRNTVSWSIMISGLVEVGSYEEAFNLFFLMWEDVSDASPRMFATIIRATAGLGFILAGRQFHSCVIKMGFYKNIFISCALIDMYSKCGCIEEAQWVFDEMPEKTVVGWNTIIAGYALHGYSEKALDMYYEMCSANVQMDHFTYSIFFRICARLGSLEHAKQAHAGLVRNGFGLDIVANTALVDLYCKWGRMEDARNVFEKMPRRNLLSWNALIGGYGNHGMGIEAVKMYEKMREEGMVPDHVTFLAVLGACNYSGLLDKGREIFEMMSRNPSTKPRAMHYACMIELFGREGLLDEAYALIKNAPFRPTKNMWAALLTACRIHKNLELGKFAAEQLFGLGPEKLSNYIVLLNIYNSSGRVDEAAKVVEALKRRGIRLLPACSWIEIKKQPHKFLFGDKSHPQSLKIYEKLDSLMSEIVERGYVPDWKSLLPDVADHEQKMLTYHSEKLAIAFGIISTPDFTPLQVVQGHRICSDCHTVIKFLTLITKREIIVRDASRFHHFRCGSCSCGDYW